MGLESCTVIGRMQNLSHSVSDLARLLFFRMKTDPDSTPSDNDILLPNGYEKISFSFKSNKVLQNNDGKNVASVKKCNTYYPKVLPLKYIDLLIFFELFNVKIKERN